MPKTIVANIRTIVKDGEFLFERDCEACSKTISLPFVCSNSASALFEFATERGKLCCECADRVHRDTLSWIAETALQDVGLKPGDWGTGHESQTEAAMIGL